MSRALAVAGALTALLAALTTTLLARFAPLAPLFLSLLVYVAVGLVLAWRRPRHPVGWLLLLFGVLMEVSGATAGYAWAALVAEPGVLPFGTLAVIVNFAWVPGLVALCLAILLFPTGRLPSPRWRLPTVVMFLDAGAMLGGEVVAPPQFRVPAPEPSTPSILVANPLAIAGPLADILRWLNESPLGAVVFIIPAAAIVARLRGSRGIERQQMKLFAYAAALAMAVFFATGARLLQLGDLTPHATVVVLDLVAIAVGVAVLRYRLYDIDILINRTLVYAVVTGLLGAIYFGSVLVLQNALAPFMSGSAAAVALSTLAVVVLFQPISTRVQRLVDRRFYRTRYDAERAVDAFAARLRDQIDLAALEGELLGAVSGALKPHRAGLWLRRNDMRTAGR